MKKSIYNNLLAIILIFGLSVAAVVYFNPAVNTSPETNDTLNLSDTDPTTLDPAVSIGNNLSPIYHGNF